MIPRIKFLFPALRVSHGPPTVKFQPPRRDLNVVLGLAVGSQGPAAIEFLSRKSDLGKSLNVRKVIFRGIQLAEREEKVNRLLEEIKKDEESEKLREKLIEAIARQSLCPIQNKPCEANCAWFCEDMIDGREIVGCAFRIIARRLEALSNKLPQL